MLERLGIDNVLNNANAVTIDADEEAGATVHCLKFAESVNLFANKIKFCATYAVVALQPEENISYRFQGRLSTVTRRRLG